MPGEGEWRDVILLTLRETPSKKPEKKDEGYGLWVVARVKPDNTLFGVTLRSGRYYPNKVDGSKSLPKEGIGFYDLKALEEKSKDPAFDYIYAQVKALCDPKHPPVLPNPGAPAPVATEPEPEMPPWLK